MLPLTSLQLSNVTPTAPPLSAFAERNTPLEVLQVCWDPAPECLVALHHLAALQELTLTGDAACASATSVVPTTLRCLSLQNSKRELPPLPLLSSLRLHAKTVRLGARWIPDLAAAAPRLTKFDAFFVASNHLLSVADHLRLLQSLTFVSLEAMEDRHVLALQPLRLTSANVGSVGSSELTPACLAAFLRMPLTHLCLHGDSSLRMDDLRCLTAVTSLSHVTAGSMHFRISDWFKREAKPAAEESKA